MTPDCSFRYGTADDLRRVAPLWRTFYDHQLAHGMRNPVPADAFDAWQKSIGPVLGRYAVLALAESNGEIVAFTAGRVRALPPYFGGATVGFISEVFVSESLRGAGVGRRLLAFTMDWFKSQDIGRVELHVLTANPDALRFYRSLGWQEELVQMVRDV